MTIQVGAFEVLEPVPSLRRPRLLVALQPWIDVGAVGTMALSFLEEAWGAQTLAQLGQPGTFYDFTRYRPTLLRKEGRREIVVPNTVLRYAQPEGDQDWLFLHALEPHSHGEEYVRSLVEVMKYLGVHQYCLIGSMYAPVPHTRAAVATGSASEQPLQERLRGLGVRESTYEGPTTIIALAIEEARQSGVETVTLLVQLPAYAQLERDYRGLCAILELLSGLYGLSLQLDDARREGERQYAALGDVVHKDPRLKGWVQELEAVYDAEAAPPRPAEEPPSLSPELESFLQEMEKGWNGPGAN